MQASEETCTASHLGKGLMLARESSAVKLQAVRLPISFIILHRFPEGLSRLESPTQAEPSLKDFIPTAAGALLEVSPATRGPESPQAWACALVDSIRIKSETRGVAVPRLTGLHRTPRTAELLNISGAPLIAFARCRRVGSLSENGCGV